MALVISNSSSVQKNRKMWMLKDYLLDDLGSCSSTGFRSFPRRQCCAAAVRSLSSGGSTSRRLLNVRSKSSSSSASVSSKISNAIQRASRAVIGAVKLIPFRSATATVSAKERRRRRKKSNLRRSLSKKLSSLWKSDSGRSKECEIERWISSGAAAAEKYLPSEMSNETTTSTAITVTSVSTTSSTNSDSWSELDSEFTQPRSSVDENGVVAGNLGSSAKSKKCVTVGHESVKKSAAKKNWSREEEKEQLSPISVLSFPDEDEETESFSPFTRKIKCMEGTKEKLMHKLRRFECLSRIGRIKLEPQFSLNTINSEATSPLQVIKEEETEEKPANRLLKLVKSKTTCSNAQNFNADNLLISFFQEGLDKAEGKNQNLAVDALLIEADDWIHGRTQDEAATSWKVKEKRKVYGKDLEEGGEWMKRNFLDLEKEDLCVQVEDEVFASLVDEMVGEFSNLEFLNFLLK